MHTKELLPCLCGEDDLGIVDTPEPLYAVACFTCNVVGPWKPDALHAALAWNHDKMALAPAEDA